MNQKYAKSFKLKFSPEADIRKSTIGDSNDFSLHWFFQKPLKLNNTSATFRKTCDTAKQSEAIGTTVSRHISSRFFNESLRCNYDGIVVSCSHLFVRTSCFAYRQPLSRTSLLMFLFEAFDMRCFHTRFPQPRRVGVERFFCTFQNDVFFVLFNDDNLVL